MNPLTNVKNIQKLSEQELKRNSKTSWHDQYKDSAWVFIGGLPYDLTEGDIICVFSQYGEIVNINLIRDKGTGKSKGFCFLCYEDQRSTILAVDNFNGMKLLGRVIRVDHVSDYKPPKESKKVDDVTNMLYVTGCAPGSSVLNVSTNMSVKEERDTKDGIKKIKKEKKDKVRKEKHKKSSKKSSKKKKKKKKKESSSSSSSSESESSDSSDEEESSEVSSSETSDKVKTFKKTDDPSKVKNGRISKSDVKIKDEKEEEEMKRRRREEQMKDLRKDNNGGEKMRKEKFIDVGNNDAVSRRGVNDDEVSSSMQTESVNEHRSARRYEDRFQDYDKSKKRQESGGGSRDENYGKDRSGYLERRYNREERRRDEEQYSGRSRGRESDHMDYREKRKIYEKEDNFRRKDERYGNSSNYSRNWKEERRKRHDERSSSAEQYDYKKSKR